MTSIESGAFSGCSSLTSITIPNSVTSIENGVFSGCSGLTSVTIPNSVTSIEIAAFSGCSSLTSITIPNNVTSIRDYTFRNCSGLTSITIPNSITSIGYEAFYNCSGLTSIDIPNSVTSIGSGAFSGCRLTSVTIPSSVSKIGVSPFSSCSALTSIIVDDRNPVFDSREGCNAIVRTSDNKLIEGCINTSIPNSVNSIGEGAFFGCSGLTSVTIPNSVTSIGDYAFGQCGLNSITIPNSVTSIGEGTFYNCVSLTSITIPNSVSNIGNYAFDRCSSLISVAIKNETPINIKKGTFSNRANAILYVPKGAKTAYAAADYWKEFKEIVEISPNMGDANGDGVVNVADVVEAVNAMNDKTSTKFKFSYADLNQKGKIDQTDIDIIVNLIYSNIPKLYIPEPVPVPTQGDRNAVGSGGGFL